MEKTYMAHGRVGDENQDACMTVEIPEADQLTDGQLLEMYVQGRDKSAFTALVARCGGMVFGICKRVLQNPDDAEDAFQTTFLVLARKAESLDRRRSLGGWLYSVAYRTAVNLRAAIARRCVHEKQSAALAIPTAIENKDWDELRPVLVEEMGHLAEKYRVLLVLCYLEGRTHQQAARHLGWPSGSVSRRMCRARELLRERLTRRGFGAG